MKVVVNEDRCVLLHGDSSDICTMVDDNSVDAVVTDPPAGIAFMGKTWDEDKGGRDAWIAWLRGILEQARRVLKPGGHALIWALPRTSHWTATAAEDAGFEIRDVHHHIFGCVPPETEILTARGWVTYDKLIVGEAVAQVDASGAASFSALQAVTVFPFVGDMRRIVTRSTEQLLTPGHTVHAYARRAKWKRIESDAEMTALSADTFTDGDHPGVSSWRLPLAARSADVRAMLSSEDVAELLGWVIAEGHFHRDVEAVSIYQNEGAHADQIRRCLARLDIPHSEYQRTRDDYDSTPRLCVQWYIKVGPWADYIRGMLAGDKPTPRQELAWLPSHQALALFEALVSGDGSRNLGGQSGAWYQKRPEVRAWFQTLCFRLGYRSTENASKCAVQWSRTDTTEVARGCHRTRWASSVPYSGVVWCPTVPTGRWVARYRGNVFITGNTGFPKSLTSKSAPIPEGTGTAVKPAVEHWILARKPLDGTVADNHAAHGTGVLNIDACRIGTEKAGWGGRGQGSWDEDSCGLRAGDARPVVGRWPAHLSLEHAETCGETCVLGCPVRLLDEQSGNTKAHQARQTKHKGTENGSMSGRNTARVVLLPADVGGGASRFFYIAKGSRSEKDAGLEHLEPKTGGEVTGRAEGSAGSQNPRAGAGARGGARNHHPTVKSVDLMRWLVRLITPPGGTVLDLFAGSGTTGVAALAEGCNFIGVERGDEYIPIIEGRLRHALKKIE